MRLTIGLRYVACASLLAVFTAAGMTYAVIPGSDGVIHACLKKSGGAVRIIDAALFTCAANELALSWNRTGPPGAPGISGYEIVTESDDFESTETAFGGLSVACPVGKSVLGGGGSIFDAGGSPSRLYDVIQSYPSNDGAGWSVVFSVANPSPTPTFRVTVHAICAFVES